MGIIKSLLVTLVAVFASATWALAQTYPTKEIRLIVPSSVGAWNDVSTRSVVQKMGVILGQSIVVVNRPGALGKIALDECMRARSDGYTICQANWGHMGALVADSIASGDSPTYDPGRYLIPIGQMAEAQYVLVANKEIPATTFAEFVAYARARPRELLFATPSPFSVLVAGILRSVLRVDMIEVPYTGANSDARSTADLVGNHIHIKVGEVHSMKSFSNERKVNLLGVFAGRGRSPSFSNVPSLVELGISEFGLLEAWTALWAPPGTPPEIARKLNSALVEALNDRDVQEAFNNLGVIPRPGTPEELTALRANVPTLADLIRRNNIRIFGR
ncbi:MAG: tripartite tricarboxylate transporter substrate binding protein [bacterium]|nr:tripartite tricarboxylate transporter substrate binding protein [bacterium]